MFGVPSSIDIGAEIFVKRDRNNLPRRRGRGAPQLVAKAAFTQFHHD
jgi:hypothetical protein